jgi:hypothetical protein
MNDLPPEDRIKARLRELTQDSRRLRAELEELIRNEHEPDRTRSLANDRPKQTRPSRRPPR